MFYENKERQFAAETVYGSFEYPIHIHQYIEIVHVVKGQLHMRIGSDLYTLTPGQYAIIFPNVPHDYKALLTDVQSMEIRIINCRPDLLPLHKKQLLSSVPQVPVLDGADVPQDVFYAEKRLFEFMIYQNEERDTISSLLSLMMSGFFSQLHIVKFDSYNELSCDVLEYLGNHFQEDISLSSIAEHFGLGKYTLSRIFSDTLGIRFYSYLNNLRINYAKHLLVDTDKTIYSIAIQSGYNNQQTFNRVFLQECGCTPREYRRSEYRNLPAPIIQEDIH